MKTSEKEGKMENTDFVFLYRIHLQFIFTFILKIADELGNTSVVCMVQIQKQEKIHMQHK